MAARVKPLKGIENQQNDYAETIKSQRGCVISIVIALDTPIQWAKPLRSTSHTMAASLRVPLHMTFNLGILTTGLRLYERFCNKRFSFMCQHIINLSCPSAVTLNLGVLSECTYDVKKTRGTTHFGRHRQQTCE